MRRHRTSSSQFLGSRFHNRHSIVMIAPLPCRQPLLGAGRPRHLTHTKPQVSPLRRWAHGTSSTVGRFNCGTFCSAGPRIARGAGLAPVGQPHILIRAPSVATVPRGALRACQRTLLIDLHLGWSQAPARLSARGCPARVHAKAEGKVAIPDKAADAVNRGLELFSGGDYESALRMFRAAMDKRPTADEARAAEYNAACACTKLQRWEEAARAVEAAVERYDLKLSVAIRDKDLAALRERREWAEMLTRLKGAPDKKQLVQMRAEVSVRDVARASLAQTALTSAAMTLVLWRRSRTRLCMCPR